MTESRGFRCGYKCSTLSKFKVTMDQEKSNKRNLADIIYL